MDKNYKLYICGARGSRPVCGQEFSKFGGDTSCYLFKNDTHAIIIDCGTGLDNATKLIQDCLEIDIILTHVHYDHIIGLLGHSGFPQGARLRMFATFSKWSNNDILQEFSRKPFWPVYIFESEDINCEYKQKVQLTENSSFTLYKSNHPDDTSMVKLNLYDKNICVLCDYEHGTKLDEDILDKCDWLLYDGMICPTQEHFFKGWGHSNWKECGILANRYNIKNVLVVHHSPNRTDDDLEDMELQAKIEYPLLHFARVGEIYDV